MAGRHTGGRSVRGPPDRSGHGTGSGRSTHRPGAGRRTPAAGSSLRRRAAREYHLAGPLGAGPPRRRRRRDVRISEVLVG
ncbi:MAG: hypothetical protein E5X61_37205, partial [Mesorhizobium sp.]